MALESWMYGDPEDVAARREAIRQRKDRLCGECAHRVCFEFKGEEVNLCEFNHEYGKQRCVLDKRKSEAK